MFILPRASRAATAAALRTDLSTIKLPSVKVELKKTIYNKKHGTNPNDDVFFSNTKSGDKIIHYSDTCVTEGNVHCLICSTIFNINDNTGVIIGLTINEDDVMVVKTTKTTCSHNCSMAFISEEKKKGTSASSEYINSQSLHLTAYSRQYPNSPPLETPGDRSLLRVFGGSMSVSEWHRNSFSLLKSPTMKVVVLKSVYSKTVT